jgi:hypothetical protein
VGAVLKQLRAGVFPVPGVFVSYLRAGLHWQLGHAADEIAQLSLQPRGHLRSEGYAAALARQDASRALLNLTGWDPRHSERDVPVNLYRHAEPLLAALRFIVNYEVLMIQAPDHGQNGHVELDVQSVYGLRFFVNGLEGIVAALPSVPTTARLALRIGADLEVAALAAWSGDTDRLWSDAIETTRRAAEWSRSRQWRLPALGIGLRTRP